MGRGRRFLRDASGTTPIEYGVIAFLIAVGIIVGVTTIGSRISTKFYDNIGAAFK